MRAFFSRQSMLGLCTATLFSISLACGGGSGSKTSNNGAPAPGGANPGPGGAGGTTAGSTTGSGTATGGGTTTGSGTGTGGSTSGGSTSGGGTTSGGSTGSGTGGSTTGGGSGSGTGGGTGGNGSPNGTGYLYVTNNGSEQNIGGTISAFSINMDTGALTPVSGSPFRAGDAPAAIASTMDGQFVFVAESRATIGVRGANCTLFHGVLLVERIDKNTGALTQSDKKELDGVCPGAVAVDPSGSRVYVGMDTFNRTQLGEIQIFQYSSAGTLIEMPGSPVLLDQFVSDIAFDPNGSNLYVATQQDGSGIVVLKHDRTTGALSPQSIVNVGPQNRIGVTFTAAVSTSGFQDGKILSFHREENGDLTPASTIGSSAPIGVAIQPGLAAVTEMENTSDFSGGISMFKINSSTGVLTRVPGSPFPDGHFPNDVKFTIGRDQYVFATSRNDGTVSGYRSDIVSAALTPVNGSPWKAGDNPIALTIVRFSNPNNIP